MIHHIFSPSKVFSANVFNLNSRFSWFSSNFWRNLFLNVGVGWWLLERDWSCFLRIWKWSTKDFSATEIILKNVSKLELERFFILGHQLVLFIIHTLLEQNKQTLHVLHSLSQLLTALCYIPLSIPESVWKTITELLLFRARKTEERRESFVDSHESKWRPYCDYPNNLDNFILFMAMILYI